MRDVAELEDQPVVVVGSSQSPVENVSLFPVEDEEYGRG